MRIIPNFSDIIASMKDNDRGQQDQSHASFRMNRRGFLHGLTGAAAGVAAACAPRLPERSPSPTVLPRTLEPSRVLPSTNELETTNWLEQQISPGGLYILDPEHIPQAGLSQVFLFVSEADQAVTIGLLWPKAIAQKIEDPKNPDAIGKLRFQEITNQRLPNVVGPESLYDIPSSPGAIRFAQDVKRMYENITNTSLDEDSESTGVLKVLRAPQPNKDFALVVAENLMHVEGKPNPAFFLKRKLKFLHRVPGQTT